MNCNTAPKGFTLIEIITVIVIMGIIGGFGSIFLMNMIKNYQWAEDNAHLAQKAQVALTRIAVEAAYADSIDAVNDDEILINFSNGPSITIYRDGDTIFFEPNNSSPFPLADRLKNDADGFTVEKENSKYLTVTLRMIGANQAEQAFTKSIALPR